MARVPQPEGTRGSLRWIQHFANEDSGALAAAIGLGPITWISPRKDDDYAEYRDSTALDELSVTLLRRSLSSFWPPRGPQWDALGRAASGELILVEAKAHISEILTPGTKASPQSMRLICASLNETAKALRASAGAVDWSQRFYQYTNRLAHAYLLRVLNGIPAMLVFVYFIGDRDMDGPQTRREWESAIAVLHEALGLRGRMPPYVKDAYLRVPV